MALFRIGEQQFIPYRDLFVPRPFEQRNFADRPQMILGHSQSMEGANKVLLTGKAGKGGNLFAKAFHWRPIMLLGEDQVVPYLLNTKGLHLYRHFGTWRKFLANVGP